MRTPEDMAFSTTPARREGGRATCDLPELLAEPGEDTRQRLGRFFRERGEPEYRAGQVEKWVWERAARSFDEMTNIPAALREPLAEAYSLTPIEPDYVARSRDGTIKHLWRLDDGERVESVLIPTRDRLTLCLSSQAGCALACRFCATGYFGFRRQLRAAEIVAQYRESLRVAREELGRPISNVVYMGMGEPLANLDAVIGSLRALHEGFGLGARRITVSTVGLIPGILELARRPEPFELALSLHAPTHDLRLELMPIEKRYPLPELFEALRKYQSYKNRRLSFEYTLIRGVNDDPALADALADLAEGLICFVNLIPFNSIPSRPEWSPSSPSAIERFSAGLAARGVGNAVRRPRGRDIAAACGQLRLSRES
ncbi:23S rRNA (adenine(2503)-C(2))-methyltransferase RlmN [Candidatus Palauibacter sp.]|uniref:23S rRNA (adenine(2503)-C(2))-methyltransferase RlmN n=1 Tax=Candidatus Palauibacter sp. TaxID=3101350 RepID=UPI003AF24314